MTFDLAPYDHVALDMNGTFVFDYDRFGPGADFGASYARFGFARLTPAAAHGYVRDAYDYMAPRYADPAYYARFPTVAEALAATSPRSLSRGATAELVATFAEHEFGHLPAAHARAIAALARLRPQSVISNLWSPGARWRAAFRDWGIARHFAAVTWSSDGPHVKPHPALFARHLAALGLSPKRVLYVGDSHRCDVAGARAAGVDAVWLTPGERDVDPPPVATFADLPAFAKACVHLRPV